MGLRGIESVKSAGFEDGRPEADRPKGAPEKRLSEPDRMG